MNLDDDGLLTDEVGAWAEQKYKLVGLYADLFSTGMKGKWDERVYIDLFAGPGRVRIRGTDRIVASSPTIALQVKNQFTRYIFCEESEAKLEALRERVRRDFPGADVTCLLGDCNQLGARILELVPTPSRTEKVLSFCFADPYSLSLRFSTIRGLSSRYVDFLILLALAMDLKRNAKRYASPGDETIARFIDDPNWRESWEGIRQRDNNLSRFIAKRYADRMLSLGYRERARGEMIEVRSDDRNLPLYHLAFLSRHDLGYRYWKEVRKYSDQPPLF